MSIRINNRGWVWLMLLVPAINSSSQDQAAGARSISMGSICAGLEDAWAVINNPAGLARYRHISVATSLEQRFLMKELGFYTLAASLPAGAGCMGLSARFSGYGSFIEQKYNLGYGRLFGEHFLAGISLAYVFQTTGGETRPMHQVSYGIGTVIIVSDKVNLAFNSFNPFQLYFRNSDYATLPSVFRICLSWQYSSDLLLLTECEKDLDLPPQWKVGIEYRAGDIFFIRGGIRLFPLSLAFGTAMRHQRFLFEFASCYHQVLGFTPQVSLQYDFK